MKVRFLQTNLFLVGYLSIIEHDITEIKNTQPIIRILINKITLVSFGLIVFILGISINGCSPTKTVLQTVSIGEFFVHHPISLAMEAIANDLHTQLSHFISTPIIVEAFFNAEDNEKDDLGRILSYELKNSLTRLGYIVMEAENIAPGKASFNYDLERAQINVSGRYFVSVKRLAVNAQAVDLKTNIIMASSSASVLRTEEVNDLIKKSKKKGIIRMERTPLKNYFSP